jgi:hypothetical protein
MAAGAASPTRAEAAPAAASAARTFSDAETTATQSYWTEDRVRDAVANSAAQGDDVLHSEAAGEVVHSVPGRIAAPAWIGIITFRSHGQNFGCSASAVRSDSKLLVATAGHCLYKDGTFSTDVAFIPEYDGRHFPFGRWVASGYQVAKEWHDSADMRHDAGFVKLDPQRNSQGQAIYLADVTSARPMDFGLARPGLHYSSFGYDAITTYSPTPLGACSGPGYQDTDGQLLQIGCQSVEGMSGGPVYHYSVAGAAGTQVGVISTSRETHHGTAVGFVPWGDGEYALAKTVDDFSTRS